MGKKYFFKIILIIFTFTYFWFCDAPRNNPFDPENPDYESSQDLTGRVLTYRVPHIVIPNVKVTWDKRRIDYSRTDGSFRFTEVIKEPGWLLFENDTYLNDSLYVDWENSGPDIQKYLNTRSVLDSILFYSSLENDNTGQQLISVDSKLFISDPDNDIDSVLITSANLKFKSFLKYNINDKSFEGSFGMSDLKISTPDAVIGQEFNIHVKDTQKNKILLSTQLIKRIIKDEVILVGPINSDTTSTLPTLEWNIISLGFNFKFTVEIYTDGFNSRLVWRKENINSSATSVTVDEPLTEDRYYRWIVWIVDEFENRSGSKTKTFYARSQ